MTTTTDEVYIKVHPFSGKTQDFIPWSALFLARAAQRGYKKLLLGKDKLPTASETESLDPSNDGDKAKLKIVTNNERGFGELLYAMNHTSAGRTAFNIVMNTQTALSSTEGSQFPANEIPDSLVC